MTTLPRSFFERDAPIIAPELLNKLLFSRVDGVVVAGRVAEVEAYTEDDPASHSFNGPTPRNEAMFGTAGHLYVYLSYGIHHCLNVVTGPDGAGQAVLIRAVRPTEGVETMRRRRGGVAERDLANGPGKLAQAFALDLGHYGLDLTDPGSAVTIVDDGIAPPAAPLVGPRIGLSKGVDTPWRFRVR